MMTSLKQRRRLGIEKSKHVTQKSLPVPYASSWEQQSWQQQMEVALDIGYM